MTMKFKRVSADETRAMRTDHVREVGGQEVMLKASKPFKAPRSWDKDTRSVRFVMSSASVDRYGDIVGQEGLSLDRFLENPQGLMFHNSRSWPIGAWSDVEKNLTGRPKRTEGTLTMLPEGVEPDADRAARHVAAGTIRTVSIGFRPDWESAELILDADGAITGGIRYNQSELLECSLVAIPAQADAIVKDAAGDWALAKETIEQILDTWVRTPNGLLMARADYENVYRSLVLPRTIVEGAAISADTRAAIKAAAIDVSALEAEELKLDAEEIDVEAEIGDEVGMIEAGIDTVVEAALEPGVEAAAGPEEVEKAVGDGGTVIAPKSLDLAVDIDIAGIEKATEKVTALGALVDTVMNKMAKLFGRKVEEVEPAPPAAPTPEEMAAVRASADAMRQRLIAKGLIQA